MSLDRILNFLSEIGIAVHERPLAEPTFLPGILIERGALVLDRTKAEPGDLLHEAGHLAVMPAAQRAEVTGDLGTGPGEEMAAIAWSYAASQHLQLAPEVLFHPTGYRGGSSSLIENFTEGRYIGVPLLQWFGMTRERSDGSAAPVYPQMGCWLRPDPVATPAT
jgi:hypothetical protein